MSNQRRFDGDITSIHWGENIDKFNRHFDVLSQCTFDGRKIDVVSMYFLRRNFNKQKIDVVSTYFVQRNFDGQKIKVNSTCFVRHSFNEKKSTLHRRTLFDAIMVSKNRYCLNILFVTKFWWAKNLCPSMYFFRWRKILTLFQCIFWFNSNPKLIRIQRNWSEFSKLILMFLKDKKSSFLHLFLKSFWYIKN